MLPRNGFGELRIAGGHRIDDVDMFIQRKPQGVLAAPQRMQRQMRPPGNGFQRGREVGIRGDFAQGAVEPDIQFDMGGIVRVAGEHSFMFGQYPPQRGQAFGVESLGRQSRGHALQQFAHHIQLPQVSDVYLAHLGASARYVIGQTLIDQTLHRLAYRRATHIELPG